MALVVKVPRELGGVLRLLYGDAQRVKRPEIGPQAHGLDAIAGLVIAEDILEIQAEVEAVDLAVAVGQSLLTEVNAVPGAREVALDEHGTSRGHHDELASAPTLLQSRLLSA